MTTNDVREQTLAFCALLNAGTPVRDAATQAGLDPDELYGDDLGDECIDIEEDENDVIDVAWDGEHTHFQLRRWYNREADRKLWEAFERHTLTEGGVPIAKPAA